MQYLSGKHAKQQAHALLQVMRLKES